MTKQRKIASRGRYQDGFSLLEMVVAVAILLILTIVGFIAYSAFTDNTRQAAVENAATQVYTAARAYMLDPSGENGPQDAVYEYNTSQTGHDRTILTEYEVLTHDRLRITATMSDSGHFAIRETPHEDGSSNPWENDDGEFAPPTGALNANMTYQCDADSTGYLGIINVAPATTVTMWETENPADTMQTVDYITPGSSFDLRHQAREEILRSRLIDRGEDSVEVDRHIQGLPNDSPSIAQEATITNASDIITMRAGVEYGISYDGEVETFAAPGNNAYSNIEGSLADCLTSIDHFGDDINLKNMVYLGGENLTGLPDNLPSTVRSLRGALENSTNLNDPNIRYWDTSNVTIMQSMLYNAHSFNQNISEWTDENGETYWDTGNVITARFMLTHTTNFNNGDEPGQSNAPLEWDTSNIRDIRQMFYGATVFNQDLSSWDTSNMVDTNATFTDAASFTQDLSSWDVSNVINYNNFTNDAVPIHTQPEKLPTFS